MAAYDDGYTPARVLAEQTGIPRSTIVRWAIGKRIDAFQGGCDWYISPASLSEHIESLGPQ